MQDTKRRRNVLKMIGSSAGAISLAGQTVAARNPKGKADYVGFKYNPRTQEVRTDISARLFRSERTLSGTVDMGNYNIPISATADTVSYMDEMDNPTPVDERHSNFKLVKGNKHASNGAPMKINLSSITNGSVSGLVRHSIDQPKEAFILKPVIGKRTKSQIISRMESNFRGG